MKHLIAILLAITTLSCASFSGYSPPPIRMVSQRNLWDCGIAVLAMATQRSYEDVDGVLDKLDIEPEFAGGMYDSDAMKVAGELGVQLMPGVLWDITNNEGILHIRWSGTNVHHYMYLKGGYIYDPLTKFPVPQQVATRNWELVLFLVKMPTTRVHTLELRSLFNVY